MIAAGLIVVRFAGTGVREYHELAFKIPRSDGSLDRVIYIDREIECAPDILRSAAWKVDVHTMLIKAHVRHTAERDVDALRDKLPEYEDVRRRSRHVTWPRSSVCHIGVTSCATSHAASHVAMCVAQVFDALLEDIALVHAMTTQEVSRRSRPVIPPPKSSALEALTAFKAACPAENVRFDNMCANIEHFLHSSQTLMPTSWVKTAPKVKGMVRINLNNGTTMREVTMLCKKMALEPPKKFVKHHSFHYGKYKQKKLVSIISLSTMNLNNIPGSIAISIDIAASKDTEHSISVAIESLKKMMRKRRNSCVLFAQVANTESARRFWQGKLTKTKRASLMTALFSEVDPRYLIYEDATDMALFYE